MKLLALYYLLLTPLVMGSSLLHPFRRNSVDQGQLAEHTRLIQDHAQRLSSLELTVSQLQVQLSNNDRRPSLQRRPEIRRSSRSDTSMPSVRRLPSDYSGGGVRLTDVNNRHLSPPPPPE